MRIVATLLTGLLGLALAVWGTVQLMPRELQAAELAGAGAHPSVRSIRFVGDGGTSALRSSLRTQIGARADAADVASDRALLEISLIGSGHLDAQVRAEGSVDVVFHVDPGTIYRLGAVRIVGAPAAFPTLGNQLTIATGDELSVVAIQRTQTRLTAWLTARGARAVVTHRLDIDRDAKRVDVTYEIAQPAVARR